MKDVIVIGGGVAGMTASIYAVRNGFSVALIERASVGGQIALTNEVENYPGFKKTSGIELAMNMAEQATSLGVELLYEEATGLSLSGDIKRVKLPDREMECRNIILAMGQKPKMLGLQKEQEFIGRGISYCAVCDAMFYRGKTAIVIGGGNTAVQDAVHLSRFAKKVYLVHRRHEFRADKIEVQKLSGAPNIEQVLGFTPLEILADEKIRGLVVKSTDDGSQRKIDADGIFLAIGYTPNTELIKDIVKLSPNGYILTDENMQTGINGVFACGDIVEKNLRQLTTAVADGAIAGNAAK